MCVSGQCLYSVKIESFSFRICLVVLSQMSHFFIKVLYENVEYESLVSVIFTVLLDNFFFHVSIINPIQVDDQPMDDDTSFDPV